MKIGELANAARCTTETVRFYEREGLLVKASRTEANYRHYDAALLHKAASRRHDPDPRRTHATAATGTVCARPI
jgi:DNA-binding transcriptional MerR regulator